MFLDLSFIQSMIVLFVVWEIGMSIICAVKGEDYNGGFSIIIVVLYGLVKMMGF